MEAIIKVSVRNLIEFALKSGDINTGFLGKMTAVEGTKGHKAVQKMRGEGYLPEVPISFVLEDEGISLEINGRIDGIFKIEDQVIIEEIKTTGRQLEDIDENYNILHLAQGKCYAYIYCIQNNLDSIGVQLTYYHRESNEMKSFTNIYNMSELHQFFYDIVNKYLKWALITKKWCISRNDSIESIEFPFEKYRKGQREFAVAVYKSISSSKRLFAQAPTGIGKTIGTIFPAIKAIGEGKISKIFYLTAKTVTRNIAEDAFEKLRNHGLKFKTVTITAKEKICPQDKLSCKPEDCIYARGHYDRIDDAIEDILCIDNFNRETIFNYALKHRVCPFEFSLDLSLFCDGIICDYNYVFDPRVYLKRFFTDIREDYGFLIDEAHNLVDRGREMYSSEINKKEYMEIKKEIKGDFPELKKILNEINSNFINLRKKVDDNNQKHIILKDKIEDIYGLLEKFINISEGILSKSQNYGFKDRLLQLYFDTLNFLKISELYDERYVTYVEKIGSDIRIKMFCLDPSKLLNDSMKRGKSSILYSATLSPLEYFVNILGGEKEDYRIRISSPFNRANLCLLIASDVKTKYSEREFSYSNVSEYINSIICIKKGNYFVFFPSYKYMKEVYSIFQENYPAVKTLCQIGAMSEKEREDFLNSFTFTNEETLVGFAVMGGVFGEGIDLTGDRLVGAIIVGVGLPQICIERDIIKDYFSNINNNGFEYAYVYPGMNKVLQAAGRVIRTENDKGIVFLIDERFSKPGYRRLMPPEWENINWVRSTSNISMVLKKFWG